MRDHLINSVWKYTHSHDAVGRIIKLSPDGKIVGKEHTNEYYWEIEGNYLIFLTSSKKKSVIFCLNDLQSNPATVEGKFVLMPEQGLSMLLTKDDSVDLLAIHSAYKISESSACLHDETQISYGATLYGDRDDESPGYVSPPVNIINFRNAEVLNQYGVIRKDRNIVNESLFHYPFFQENQLLRFSATQAGYVPGKVSMKFDTVVSGGLGIHGNYYHWLIFSIARIGFLHKSEFMKKNCVILFPDYLNSVQQQSAKWLAEHFNLPIARICDDTIVQADKLLFPHQRDSTGVDPHPQIMKTFDAMRRDLGATASAASKKIYITRSDTNFRKLENESEVELYLKNRGFDIVRFTKSSLPEQISIMANARYIIAPHGAGLTNIVFASPGAKLMEIQSPTHINWCMKKLATLANVDYGYVMGERTAGDRYRVDMDKVMAAVCDMGA